MNVKTDRRTQSRKRPLNLVYVELPPANGGMMRDLNEYGFSLRAMMPLQLSEKLAFSMTLDNGVRIDGEAIVMRLEDKGHVAALEFAGLAAHARDQIRRWLEKFEEPLSRESWEPKAPAARASTLEELREEARTVATRTSIPQPVAVPPAIEQAAPPPQSQQPLPLEPPLSAAPEVPSPAHAETELPQSLVVPPQEKIEALPPLDLPGLQNEEASPELPSPEVEPPASVVPDAPPTERLEAPEPSWPKFPRQPENALPPPPTPQLPPLLKLSSVRPSPPPEPASEPVSPSAHLPVEEPPPAPDRVPLSEILIQPPSAAAEHPSPPAHTSAAARVSSRVSVPALEPLSPWEAEGDSASPRWMESFTLGRAIGIMICLTLLAGSVVFHREVGHALIWLGQQIAGEEARETSQIPQPAAPAATPTAPGPADSANAPSAASSSPQPAATGESKTAEPPATSDHLVAHPPANAEPPDSSSGDGQDEYQRAMQILKAPGRRAELSEAVRLLWISVQKNNVSAEITLAELYHKGRGVPKSCDQTRILLSAAARRGSPDAKRRLREFEHERCRD
jgi:hypothetical protein